MSRLIDADVLKKDLTRFYRNEVTAKRLIDEQPTIEPESKWISCKERLPENYVDVLVWFEYYRYGSYNRLYQTYGIGTYSENYDSWTINHESGWHKLRVIAWQPLPEPYKEEGGEE